MHLCLNKPSWHSAKQLIHSLFTSNCSIYLKFAFKFANIILPSIHNFSKRMNKKQGILIGIALVLLFAGIALATSSASSDVEIYAFDQNPAGRDKGNEWVTLYNPYNASVEIGNWTLQTADGEREIIPEGTILNPKAYYVYSPPYQWLDNSDEAITLSDSKGEEVDKTPVVSDNENDNRYWMRNNSAWTFGVKGVSIC